MEPTDPPKPRPGRESTQWKPGQSGNPKGGPKGQRRLLRLARAAAPEMLDVLKSIAADPASRESSRVAAAQAVIDRAYGKPSQAVEVSGSGGGPVEIQVDDARNTLAARLAALVERRGPGGGSGGAG